MKQIKQPLQLLIGSFFIINGTANAVTISQSPLIVSGGAPDNLVLLPSVEWPTVNSVANLGDYASTSTYVGYFDSDKCYSYHYSDTESERYFYPANVVEDHLCSNNHKYWSGNFLNWVATQTIDPFRSAMTGGYRVKDTTTETWLEKARQDGSGGTTLFPNRRLPASGDDAPLLLQTVPFAKNNMLTRIQGLGNKMWFSLNGESVSAATTATPFNPSGQPITDDTVYEVSIRVKVCEPGLLESNCKQYGSNYKPEGLLQEYSGRLRYSVFGYLNHSNMYRDGAALRANQKSIGPYLANLNNDVQETNDHPEWDASTGVLIANPDPDDATATNSEFGITVTNSGVINYLNKFGELTTQNHKSYDPVSEMYYAGLRYVRNLGNVSAYTDMSDATTTEAKYNYADGFPVITDWKDPYEAACQATVMLGIGDIYTHRDKDLPGNTTYMTEEPTKPSEVSSDPIDVVALTNKVGQMEGLGDIGNTNSFTGRNNSAYIAGMAWYGKTTDLRPEEELPGTQNISTYWVDVLEAQSLEGMARNQYALATKYGGFTVPKGETFDPTTATSLPESWWHTNSDTLTPFGTRGAGQAAFLRPDNFFVAGQASQMVSSLKQAFTRIVSDTTGSSASLSVDSATLSSGNKAYQTFYYNKAWHGDVQAFEIDASTGELSSTATWTASEKLPAWESRNIKMRNNQNFRWANLTSVEQTALESETVVNYLRGDQTNEVNNGGTLRNRTTLLGDIVHSQPVLVGKPSSALYNGKTFTGAGDFATYATDNAARTPVLYVGANDGMLHGFNANTGVETFAFIPTAAMTTSLRSLAKTSYSHRYFVDGELTVADAYVSGAWKTILAGTLGRGGKSVFALDVTDPNNVKFLWEKSASDISALGNTLNKPLITQTSNGVWQVVLGNGPNSTAGKAQLLMINIETGAVTAVDTSIGSDNGLSGVTGWSDYANGIADYFYAGDYKGNVWRFPANASTPTLLFSATDSSGTTQPITAPILVAKDPDSGTIWSFFGTGKYLAEADIANTALQTWYGIKVGSSTVSRSDLLQRHILSEGVVGDYDVRVIEDGDANDLTNKNGWYIDLLVDGGTATGERMTVTNFFQGDALIGTSRIPDGSDICNPTGKGYVMAIDPFSGARLNRIFYDLNGDGVFDSSDLLTVNGSAVAVSGVGFSSSPNNPTFVGNVMEVVTDNSTTHSILTQGSTGAASRVSWREILNQ